MSTVAELVREARDLGAEFRVDGDSITVESPARLPRGLMAELRAHKPEVRRHLGIGRGLLLERLRRGSEWLTDVNASLLSMPGAGVGSEQESLFCDGLARWDHLEKLLRFTYPDYTACILGPGQRCPAAATARCSVCAQLPEGGRLMARQRQCRSPVQRNQ